MQHQTVTDAMMSCTTGQPPTDSSVDPKTHCSSLHSAAGQHQYNTMNHLMQSAAVIDAIASRSDLAAAGKKDMPMLELLVDNAATTTFTSHQGSDTLQMAVTSSNLTTVDPAVLMLGKKRLNTKPDAGISPLRLAVEMASVPMAKHLLEQGADSNEQTEDGWSMLHMAVVTRNQEMVQVLLVNGANANTIDNAGQSPLHVVTSPEMATLLLNHGARPSLHSGPICKMRSSPSWSAPRSSSIPVTTATTATTPLHAHVRAGNTEIVQALLRYSTVTEIAMTDATGETAFGAAIRAKKFEMGRMIVQALRDREKERKASL